MRKNFFLILFFLIIVFNLLIYIERKPLVHEEPRRAIIAQEMLISNNYIVPTVYSVPYVKKPPMHNWAIVLLSLKNKVVSNFADRLPSVISLLLIGISMLIFIKDKRIAVISTLVAMSNYLMLYSYGNKSEPDLMLTLFTLLSFFFYAKGIDNLKYILISSFFMGCGILTKGVSPLFFYPGVILFILTKKEKKFHLLKYLGLHFVFSLILPLIWIILYYHYGDINNLLHGLGSQATDRAKGDLLKVLIHFVKFPFRIFTALIPWSFLLFFYKNFNKDKKEDVFYLAIYCFICSFIILGVLPGGRGRYFMPAVPFFAIIMGFLFKDINIKDIKFKNVVTKFLFVILIISFVVQLVLGFYLQVIFLFIIAVILYLTYKYIRNDFVFEIALVNLLFFSIYVHIYDFYKVKYYFNYKKAAKEVIENVGVDLPMVVDNPHPIQLMFNYERYTGKMVYALGSKSFDRFYMVSPKGSIDCEKIYEMKYSKKSIPRLYFYKCQK